MKRAAYRFLAMLVLVSAAMPLAAHEILAGRETEQLSERDRLAAAKAEFEALDRDEVINNFEWKGPDGAHGLIVVGGYFPTIYGMGNCRRLVHIIRHPKDGGVNPTFDGVVCRSWEGKWSPEKK